jgi:hypothetical protein
LGDLLGGKGFGAAHRERIMTVHTTLQRAIPLS